MIVIIQILLSVFLIVVMIVNLITYLRNKKKLNNNSSELLMKQVKKNKKINDDSENIHYNCNNLSILNKLYKKDFKKSEYVHVEDLYSQTIITYRASETVEHYIGPHRVVVSGSRQLIIGKSYMVDGYYDGKVIYADRINGEDILKTIGKLLALERSDENDKSNLNKIGKAALFTSLWLLFLFYIVDAGSKINEIITFNIIFLSIGILIIIFTEFYVYKRMLKPMYRLRGYYQRLGGEEGIINDVPIQGKTLSQVPDRQYIVAEGIRNKTNDAIIVKKIDNKHTEKAKLGSWIVISLLILILAFGYFFSKTYNADEYIKYIEFKNSLNSHPNTEFTSYEEIAKADFIKGQNVIYQDIRLYQDTNTDYYLIDNNTALPLNESSTLEDIVKISELALEFVNYGLISDSLTDEKKNLINKYIESGADTKFGDEYSITPLTLEQNDFLEKILEDEKKQFQEIKNQIEFRLKPKIKLILIGGNFQFDDYNFNVYRAYNNFYLTSIEKLRSNLTGHQIDEIRGYIEKVEVVDGVKEITVSTYSNPYDRLLEDFKHINTLFILYAAIILLLIIIVIIKLKFYRAYRN